MKKRQKKKLIPKDTDFCYEIVGKNNDETLSLKRCPFYTVIGYIDDYFIDCKGREHPCKTPIVYCTYAKVSSEEDILLLEGVKTCGERLPKYDY